MGISGIGMSGIAKILRQQGYLISGCDSLVDQKNIQELMKLGCIIANNHQSDICHDPNINFLVHTTAIHKDHPEIIAAKEKGISIIHRATMLAEIMRTKFSIAIAGSHGKTTTTSLLTHVFFETKQNPTFIIGGHLHSLNTNAELGQGNILIAEADESDRSFLQLPKTWSIVTNVDREHFETYNNYEDIQNTFLQFMHQLPFYGFNILCLDDPGIQTIIPKLKTPYISYGQHPQANFVIKNVRLYDDNSEFDLFHAKKNHTFYNIKNTIPGIHNVLNSTAVIALALSLEIDPEGVINALQSFNGVDRRFTFKGISKERQALIFDDYGHHPEELRLTFNVARKKAKQKLIVIFQPHRFSRTKHLWQDFINVLSHSNIDQLIVTDIFPASEQPIDGINSQELVKAIKNKNPNLSICYYPLEHQGKHIINHLLENSTKNDLILFQGAGKINSLAHQLLQ